MDFEINNIFPYKINNNNNNSIYLFNCTIKSRVFLKILLFTYNCK